ncbi:hypothetical protein GCM10009639_36710 [Kitasatospora putterlickiae]|uniref:Uncharacterized protein n=1 Tax=Kitasatospora putterlickiae TaxID=221725 RepID=A0ABN1Y5A7_9ACTN
MHVPLAYSHQKITFSTILRRFIGSARGPEGAEAARGLTAIVRAVRPSGAVRRATHLGGRPRGTRAE